MVRGYLVAFILAGLPSPICIIFVHSAEGNSKLYLLVLSISPLPQEEQNSSVDMCCPPRLGLPRHFC